MKICILFVILLIISTSQLLASNDPQFWQIGLQPIVKFRSFIFSFRQEYRMDMSLWKCLEARFSLFSKNSLTKNFDFEFHYTLINSRSKDEVWYTKRHRFEFELNPRTYIDSKTYLIFRNRLELVKSEHIKTWTHIFRQRIQLTRNINNGIYENISIHNEIFYNFNDNRVFEYRFCPVDILFKVKDHYSYRLFFLCRLIKSNVNESSSNWSSQMVLGSSFEW